MDNNKIDYFEISEKFSDKTLVLIIYDIVDNKKRLKLVKLLLGFGKRVQKSAFEARLTPLQYISLVKQLPAYCSKEDSIKVYKLTGNSKILSWGITEIEEDDLYII